MRRLALILILAVAAAACGLLPATETTAPAATAPATTLPVPEPSTTPPTGDSTPAAGFDLRSCDEADAEFELFCDAYRILQDRYVDDLSDEALAEGARLGIEEYGGEPGEPDGDAECFVPNETFTPFCQVLIDHERMGETEESLVIAGIRGMVDFGIDDPNTNYFDPELFQAFNDSNQGQVQGIGSLVNTANLVDEEEPCLEISDTCRMVIVSPLPGSPSEAAGLQPDDVILAVNGEPIEGKTLDEVVSIVRGPAGTEVTLTLERDGEAFDVTITREAIDIPIIESEMLTEDVGYLRLTQFTFGSAGPFREALAELLDQGATAIILDLQSNPGGSLDDAVSIASEFLADGLVVTTQAPDRTIEYEVRPNGLATDPTIRVYVLINRGSASASEVVAGALADHDRAVLVGQPTFGKNTVQQNFPLDNGGALKVTIARWVTPNGRDFGGTGIEPDVLIEYPEGAGIEFLRDEVLRRIEAGEL